MPRVKATPSRARRGERTREVYERIRALILSLELRPSQTVDEIGLARLCDVSRTPVREALLKLAAEGLVVLMPNRVTQVAPLDMSTIRSYLEGIDVCQRAVTRWACVRRQAKDIAAIEEQARAFEQAVADRDGNRMVLTNRLFHTAIADACGNPLFAAAYKRFLDEGLRISRLTLNAQFYDSGRAFDDFLRQVMDEHRLMVRHIAARDADSAERVAALHTEHTRAWFIGYLEDTRSAEIDVAIRDAGEISAGRPGARRVRSAAPARPSAPPPPGKARRS